MEKLRVMLLPALFVLAVLSACAEYPDPVVACSGSPTGRAPRFDEDSGPNPLRVYVRDSADDSFSAVDEHPLNNTLFADLDRAEDSDIALAACVTVTLKDFVVTCDYGRANQAALSSGIAPDPTVAALIAAETTVTAEFYNAHYEVSLRTVRSGDEVWHGDFDIAYPDESCPAFIVTTDDQTAVIRTPDIADYQPFYDAIASYIQP